MDQSAQPVVEIRHLVKAYRRGGQVVPVLTDITFDIASGDYVALMGPSGSGKSTLLNLIAGIDKPDSGILRVGGIDITALGEAELAAWRSRNVGFIFQFGKRLFGGLQRVSKREALFGESFVIGRQFAQADEGNADGGF